MLISGGDGLTLAPKLLELILRGLRDIPHIEIVRIGSRVPVFGSPSASTTAARCSGSITRYG